MTAVLIVDDEAALRVLAESVLEELGYETLSAADLVEAQAVFEANPVDVLFTDLEICDEPHSGTTLATDLRRLRPDLPVLYTSAGGLTDGQRALFVPGAEFLPKPYTVDGLKLSLNTLLARRA